MNTTTRKYSKRDSATAVLKKAGIAREMYSNFIACMGSTFELTQNEDGTFVSHVAADTTVNATVSEANGISAIMAAALARNAANSERLKNATTVSKTHSGDEGDDEPVKAVRKAAKLEKVAKKLGKVVAKAVAAGDKPATCSSVMREMILAGKTNQEVWDHCQPLFGLDDKKRGYPAWYRTELKNKGLLPR